MKKFCAEMILVLLILSLQACRSEEYERKVTEKEVPPPVLQAFAKAYPNAEVRGYAEEQEGSKKIYEIAFTHEGKSIDVAYASNGELVEVEETIEAANLPQAVHDAIIHKYKAAEIKVAEKVTKGERMAYEVKVDVKENGILKRYELVFDPEGKLLKQESETDKE